MFSSPRSRSSASGVPLGTPTRQTTAHTTGEDEAMVQSALADDLQRSTPSKRPRNSLAATASSSSSASEVAAAPSPVVDRRKSPGASRSNTPRQGRSSTAASGSTPRKSRSSMVAAEAAPTEAADESTESQSGTANAALTAPIAESAAPEEVRLKRLEEALSRFLGLVDVRATSENFLAALPSIPADILEPARVELVSELKETIQREQATLIQEYELDDRLKELQRLADEADRRADRGLSLDDERMKDVWRPDLNISTALHARAVPSQRERISKLESELAEIEANNALLHAQLKANSTEADQKQQGVRGLLDALEQAVKDLQPSSTTERQLRTTLESLAAELGPRA
ncbi:unnamed protein product [Jaminaea pallidilutea]